MNKKPINSSPTKEFFHLLKTIGKVTKNQAHITSYNQDDISTFMVEISPIKGVYQHAKFVFQIQLMLYPREFPNVICLSDIYHPNIEHGEDYHNVCLNLFDNWNRSFGLIDVIQGLIFLLYQPNIHDPISSLFNSRNTSEEVFRKNVYTSLHGGVVGGVEFLPNPGIIEYNESRMKRELADEISDGIVEEEKKCNDVGSIPDVEVVNHVSIDAEQEGGSDGESFGLENDTEWYNFMNNNNAAQEFPIESGDTDLISVSGELGDDLPTRELDSPNAFYSDLICSRYDQSDHLSESEYGSNDIYHTSIVFELFGFPPSTYASAESAFGESDHFHDLEYAHSGTYDEDDFYNNNCDDDRGDTRLYRGDTSDDTSDYTCDEPCDDLFLSLTVNTGQRSSLFISQWLLTRRLHNQSTVTPAPMTSIILTNVLNPFREIIGIFYLFGGHGRLCQRTTLHMIEPYEHLTHLMAWLTNICRWSMTMHTRMSLSDTGSGQVVLYSLYVALSMAVRARLANLYNYGSDQFDCVLIK